MNFKKFKFSLITAVLVMAVVFTACDDSESVTPNDPVTVTEALDLIDIDDISDEVSTVVEGVLLDDLVSSKDATTTASKDEAESCRTKTVEEDGDTKTVTIDFGDGCTTPKGRVLSGKIIMVYERDVDAAMLTITQTYENFMVDGKSVEGESVIVRKRENNDGYPEWSKTFETTVTFEDGTVVTREGNKVRVMIEGSDTRNRGDDVFEITGSWESVNKEGVKKEATVITPLIRSFACKFIISGEIKIERGDEEGTINFGDGTCDNTAIFTNSEGEETEITLGERRRKD